MFLDQFGKMPTVDNSGAIEVAKKVGIVFSTSLVLFRQKAGENVLKKIHVQGLSWGDLRCVVSVGVALFQQAFEFKVYHLE